MNLNVKNRAVQKKQTRKVKKKLRRLQNAKKLKRYMVDAIKDVNIKKHAKSRKRAVDVSYRFFSYFKCENYEEFKLNFE